jgi:alpha-galactosidase
MEFGLWVEPEGVNADSLLFAAHPEWVLQVAGRTQPVGRHQFVLDLGRHDVQDHLFDTLAALLRSAPIDFLKWDMNRDFTHEANAEGRAGAFAHVRGLHALLARLREAFPALEIESCASGGARADVAMLEHARRIWLSDCNDPMERQRMHVAALQLLPPEVIGAHVGPRLSHTTGRSAAMPARTLTPWLFHFGIEADLLDMPTDELDALAAAVRAYKAARGLWDGVETTAIDTDDPAVTAVLAVSADRNEGWLTLACIDRPRSPVPGMLTLPGLRSGTAYRVEAHDLWPAAGRGLKRGAALDRGESFEASGELLSVVGLRRPQLWPGDVTLIRLSAVRP